MSSVYPWSYYITSGSIAPTFLCGIALEIIKKELRAYGPENVVWEIEDLSKQPPWGNNISKDITDLSNYFVTSDGDDFLKIFMHALKKAKELNCELEIKTI